MTSVLEIAQAFCYESNIPAPAAGFYNSTSPADLQLKFLIYAIGRDLRQAKCWPQLKRTTTITTSNGDDAYALPSDYYAPLPATHWDTTNQWQMLPVSDIEFNELLYGYYDTPTRTFYRIFGRNGTDQFQVYPTPGSTALTLKFDYMSKFWILTGASTWQETISADADTVAFDDDLMILGLKMKWYQMKGLDWTPLAEEYRMKIDRARGRWEGSRKTSLTGGTGFLNIPNIPDGSYTL